MKILIIYKTRHHSTEQYAKWIHEEVKSDIVNVDDTNYWDFKEYDIILFGTWIYEDKLTIAPFIKENWDKFKSKKLLLFSNGLTNKDDIKTSKIYRDSLPEHIRNNIKFFAFGGNLSFDSLNWYEKFKLKYNKKYRETHCVDKELIRPIVVKLYDLKTFGE